MRQTSTTRRKRSDRRYRSKSPSHAAGTPQEVDFSPKTSSMVACALRGRRAAACTATVCGTWSSVCARCVLRWCLSEASDCVAPCKCSIVDRPSLRSRTCRLTHRTQMPAMVSKTVAKTSAGPAPFTPG
eukprot:scaffold33345_cov123-Isochrysis_galbana.AAC.8